MKALAIEFLYFVVANARASAFGAFLLAVILLTHFFEVPFVGRYDFIFLAAVLYQAVALIWRFEKPKEFFVIFVFHIVATVMELFKTNASIGSWQYPEVETAIFAVATVPLFTGFLYSAVGSYISRAFTFLNLSYTNFPAYVHVWIVSIAIYANFFTHHFVYDFRYIILLYILAIFYKTKVHFVVYKKTRTIPFLLAGVLTAFFVWVAENIGTATKVWLYPNQQGTWHLVSPEKIGSWFLLLVLSFALVSLVHRARITHR